MRWRVVRGAACVALLCAGIVAGVGHTWHAAHTAREAIGARATQPVVGGQLVLFSADRTEFVQFVRRIVPEHDEVRVVEPVAQPDGHAIPAWCTPQTSGPAYWWLVYAIAPRASVCDPTTTWTVYYGIAPPAGVGTVFRFADKYAVVRR